MTVFLQAKEIEVRRLAMLEAARAEAEAARLTQEAIRGAGGATVEQAIEEIGKQQEAEAIIAAPAKEVARVRSASGGTAALAESWTYSVVDLAKVPRQLLMIDDAKVRAMVKAGIRKIEGLIIKNEPKTTIR